MERANFSPDGVWLLAALGTSTTYDEQHRDQIVQMAQNFLQTRPRQDYRAAAGMSLESEFR